MFESILHGIIAFFAAIPFSKATWLVLGILGFFVWLFRKAQRDPASPIDWEDLIVDDITGKTSPYKVGYLLGLIVGTWVVITYADSGKLDFDIFGVYLSYLLGGAGWTAFMKMKAANGNNGNGGGYRPGGYGGGYRRPPPKLDDDDEELDDALPPHEKK